MIYMFLSKNLRRGYKFDEFALLSIEINIEIIKKLINGFTRYV